MAVNPIGEGGVAAPGAEQTRTGGASFADSLTRFINEVNQDQLDAGEKIQQLAVDGKGTIHEAMIAMNNAEGSFRLLMAMRNRLVDGLNRLLQTRG
jgi:flagellar hook-basal body complex protein FliE